mmetsp:Transcript_86043/g.229620  ORF Transcript_86043/g.229620 Transcript_86043/m.229620 type:complete len:112 (-) Transcript_86043:468-803(-)
MTLPCTCGAALMGRDPLAEAVADSWTWTCRVSTGDDASGMSGAAEASKGAFGNCDATTADFDVPDGKEADAASDTSGEMATEKVADGTSGRSEGDGELLGTSGVGENREDS